MECWGICVSPQPTNTRFPNKLSLSRNPDRRRRRSNNYNLQFHVTLSHPPLQASRRIRNYPQEVSSWGQKRGLSIDELGGDDLEDEDDDEEDEDEDRSLDLLVRFVQNVFKKVSRRARRAVRSVLPVTISPKLVGFSVNGVIVLAFLWVLKAFLEVVCTLGSVVFVSILLIRGVWSGVLYLQESRKYRVDEFDDERRPWNGAQPAS